ncbi:MAG TPA: lactonase family protein, partial [Flavitalea sp.]|nr:lactonase family protein [Flavitalea sp.]
HTGSSVNKDRQEKPHVHSVVFSPDKRFLAVTDLGTDKIYLYPFDADSKKPVGETPMEFPSAPGAGPRHIVFHKTMPYAYVIEEISGNVTAYKYFGGKLTRIQTISSHPAGFQGEIGSAAIRISGDGRFLYASNRGSSNTISIFALNKNTGKLSSKGFQDCLGENPRDFNIDPSGRFLVCVNGKSNQLVVFARNKATGLLTPSGTPVEIPTPVSVEFMYMK